MPLNNIVRTFKVVETSRILILQDIKTKCNVDATDDRLVGHDIHVGDLIDQYLVEDSDGDRHTFFIKKIDFKDKGKEIKSKVMKLIGHRDAIHLLGYIGRPDSNITEYIAVHYEKEDYYVGNFIEGLGFIDVHFPKHQCDDLTPQEQDKIDRSHLVIV